MIRISLPIILLSAVSVFANAQGAPSAIYKSAQEIDQAINKVQDAGAGGAAVNIAPGVSVRKRMSGVKQFAIVHPWSMEIYRRLEGRGTFVYGG